MANAPTIRALTMAAMIKAKGHPRDGTRRNCNHVKGRHMNMNDVIRMRRLVDRPFEEPSCRPRAICSFHP